MGQTNKELEIYNIYIDFLNESVHGLFTAHALMVISNKEVNKYIDLDSYILNNISNKEVQSNLFDKSDQENYTTYQGYSPLQLKDLAKEKSSGIDSRLAASLNRKLDKIVVILNRINKLRFEIDDYIKSQDLTQKESIYGVFEYLEECVSLFENYATQHNSLASEIRNSLKNDQDVLYRKARRFHEINKTILLNLKKEKDDGLAAHVKNFETAFNIFENELNNYSNYNKFEYNSYIKNRKDSISSHLNRFISTGYVPVQHELYGKYYYYHNQIAKRFFNWSGPGYVRQLNALLENLNIDFVHLDEEPLIFKVVYPMKMDEVNSLNNTKLQVKDANKANLSQRKLVLSPSEIRVDESVVTLEIYDYNMIDKDSISLYFNGEWILENYCLRKEPKKIEIKLEEGKDNLLELHANNLGIRAPNTAAISYRYNGVRKRILLKSNLQVSESIKIKLEKPN
jgi:hypothetical protein